MKIATAFALLALVAVLSFMTDTGRAAIPPNAARSVMVSYGAHGEGRGVARIASRPTISKTLWKRRYAIHAQKMASTVGRSKWVTPNGEDLGMGRGLGSSL